MEKENLKKFVISLYKPVKCLTIVMIVSMIISQILDLAKQYIIKGIIDLPSMENFQISDLYNVTFILLVVIVLELIFFYISNITRTIHIVKKQTPYISEKLFNIRGIVCQKDPFTPEKSQDGAVGAQKEEAENRRG